MRLILSVFFFIWFSVLSLAEADIKIVRHEISKDALGKLQKAIIGIEYTNPITKKTFYVDRVFTIGVNGDFQTIPTKLEFRAKIKEWITAVPEKGLSVLQNAKNQTDVIPESFIELKEGDAQGFIGETINEN